MHDIKLIRDNPQAFDAGLASRGLAPLSASLIAIDERRRKVIADLQGAQERRNAASKEIGAAMGRKDMVAAEALKAEVAGLKDRLAAGEAEQRDAEAQMRAALETIPNIPAADVPQGADEHGNVEYRRHGTMPEEEGGRLHQSANALKEHFELGEALGQMDFETAAKLSGSRFVVLNRGIARLSRALGQFMLDLHTTEHGYDEVNPPLLVRDDAMFGTAQLPKFADDQFSAGTPFGFAVDLTTKMDGELFEEFVAYKRKLQAEIDKASVTDNGTQYSVDPEFPLVQQSFYDKLKPIAHATPYRWLIPTAEVPLTNLVRESILDDLDGNPRRYTALTPCFRAEAGSAGRDTRGMLRQHQFEKVELVSITTPDASKTEHERMVTCAETVLKKLDLHFRTMTLCTGDMGFASQKTYDIEVWLPGQKAYREISSCSVCGDFQARRMNARFRTAQGKATQYVHTLNGSGVAVGRALIAVMENYQNPDGSVTVPDVLLPYMGGITRVESVKR